MRAHAPKESGTVEQRKYGRRQKVECYQGSWCALLSECWNRSPCDQEEPQEQANEKRRLPDPAQVNVFIPLVSEPKPQTTGQLMHDRQPLSGHRTQNNN